MKKFIFILPVFLICLTGCGAETGSIECTLSTNDVINGYQLNSTYKINYKGDFAESVETTEIVTSDSTDTLNYFENYLNTTYQTFDDTYGGYNYKVTKEDGKVTSDVTIDYNEMYIEQYVEDQPSLKIYVEDNKILKDGLISIYEDMGATCNN